MCSASNSRPCAKCLRSCGVPIAGRSVSNSSIFLIRRRRPGFKERVEGPDKEIQFTREGKRAILGKLIETEGFENFFDVKFHPRRKRFGLDGAEAMISALEQIIKRGGQLGLKEIALGMADRGRLNVLSQVMGKPHRVIFHEFKGARLRPMKSRAQATSNITLARLQTANRRQQRSSLLEPHRLTSRLSTRSCSAKCAPSRTSSTTELSDRKPCRSSSMATPLLPDKAWWPNASACRACAATGPAARYISSSTTRSASPLSALFALLALSIGCRQAGRVADLPRQRR